MDDLSVNARMYRLSIRVTSGTIVNETVERFENTTTELFDLMIAAIARRYGGTVVDIKEIKL